MVDRDINKKIASDIIKVLSVLNIDREKAVTIALGTMNDLYYVDDLEYKHLIADLLGG